MSYLDGLEFCSAHKFSKALKVFKDLLAATDPSDVTTQSILHGNIAQIELEIDLIKRALTSADQAITISPGNLHAYIAKANCFEKQGDINSSIKTLEECMEILPHTPCDIQLYNHLKGELAFYRNKKEQIIEAEELKKQEFEIIKREKKEAAAKGEDKKVEKKKPGKPGKNQVTINFKEGQTVILEDTSQLEQLEILRGNELFNEGKLLEAIEIYTKLINGDDTRTAFKWQSYLARGSALTHLMKLDEAYRDFSEVLQVDEKNIEALKRRGKVRLALGDFNGAEKDFKDCRECLTEKDQEDADIEKEMAVIFNKEGRYHDALGALKTAEKLAIKKKASSKEKEEKRQEDASQSILTEIQCIRSHIYNSLGMSKEAEKYAQAAMKVFPESRDAIENLAKALKELQQYEKSEQMFLKAIEIQPIFTPTYNLLAFMRFSLANLTGTIEIASKGLEKMENYSDLLYLKACSFHGLGQFKQSIEWYQKVIKLDRNHWAFYHIDLARFHQNIFDDPLWSWNLDRHFHSDFKERWSKREPSSTLKYYVNQPPIPRKSVPLNLGQKLEPNLKIIYDAASLFKTKIQYNSPGFCKNEKQHRQSGIAIIHMAQVARSFWNAFSKGEIIEVNGFAQSSGKPEPFEHEFGWRDFFDIAVAWRQISEPSDPVWWIDMLCEDTFSEGYGAFTPVLMGESHVVRYYQYHDRMIGLMRELMPQQNSFTSEQRNVCFEAKRCDDLYQLLLKDFYVHTNCTRLTDAAAQPLEGTRLTIQRNKNGYVLSIRTPCTPERWKMFNVEMQLAWLNLAQTMKESTDIRQIVKDILVVAFYWYNFMPLVRGTALCGLVAIHALLLAAGLQIKGDIPERLQIDWEAILNKDPDSFIASINEWLDGNVVPLEQGFLDGVPNVEENINTLRKAFQVLNYGFKLA